MQLVWGVIGRFKLELIITNHLWFVVKVLWKYCEHNTFFYLMAYHLKIVGSGLPQWYMTKSTI